MEPFSYVLWGVAKGEAELWKEVVLSCRPSFTEVSEIRTKAHADGWHHLRITTLSLTARPDFVATVR